jgi:hypothetical protein
MRKRVRDDGDGSRTFPELLLADQSRLTKVRRDNPSVAVRVLRNSSSFHPFFLLLLSL